MNSSHGMDIISYGGGICDKYLCVHIESISAG